ncbi:MAG TPA: DegQ family serine endoprotease [Gammaproteobacteria bacterium]|nr:DegQ family serine endoprotease [Gammaproteobacteria bacterium]
MSHRAPKGYLYVVFATLAWLAAASASARPALPDFTQLVQENSAAVVNISTTQKVKTPALPPGMKIPDIPKDSPFGEFFKKFFGEDGGAPQEHEAQSLGSGFIISSDGDVLTNYHVVKDADQILVRLSDRRELKAKVIGYDERSDIALLKIHATGLPTVQIGDSSALKVGAWVLAIGSPFGFDHSATAGIVSAKGRNLPSENYVPFIQTDVAINPGNSGGPLFNLDGQVVGINSQIFSRTGGYMGLSFAIPIEVAMDVAKQLKTTGHVTRGWLGVLIQDVNSDLAKSFGLSKPEGALVAKVLPHSPAAKAGIKVGDVILSFEGKEISDSSALPPLVGHTHVGEKARVKVLRNGKPRELTVVIGQLPDKSKLAHKEQTGKSAPTEAGRLGLSVGNLTADQRKELEIDHGGVVVQDVADGAAAEAGIRKGDVILMLQGHKVTGARQFRELVKKLPGGESVAVLVQRGQGPVFLALQVPK